MKSLLLRTFCTAKKQSIVVIGTGWAGYKFLQGINPKKYDVTIVSPRNHFVFTPLLASTSVGTLEFRCISEPVRALSQDFTYYQAFATSVDSEKRVLHCENAMRKEEDFTISYDKLIIACGAKTNTFGTPGVAEHAFFLKEISDARKIRKRIIDCFELASEPNTNEEEKKALLHFAVVGGGPTGIELSAEIHDFIVQDVHRLYPNLKALTKLTVYDVADKILGGFDSKLGEYAAKKFRRDGTEIKTKTKIKEVKPDRLILEDSEVKVGMVVWATGLAPNQLIKNMSLPKDKSQRLLTDGFLRVLKENREPVKDVYALGDCATIENYNLPQTAQVAEQKGSYLSKTMNNPSTYTTPFNYRHKGAMAYVGDSKALVDSPTTFKESGYIAWLIWRSAYATMTVSWKNKILIPIHWFMKWAFGRDTSRF